MQKEGAAKTDTVDFERLEFEKLIVSNPNYFGTIKESKFPVVKSIVKDTKYEELMCVGLHPQIEQLEAVVHVKLNNGYSGPLCSGGSHEYVRFYLSYDGGSTWKDQGLTYFTAYNFPGDRPLEYAITLPVSLDRKFCKIENLIKVRAILSWKKMPTPDTPDFDPVWGNVLEADIQVEPKKWIFLKDLLEVAEIKPEIVALIEPTLEIKAAEPKELTLQESVEVYVKAKVPQHRFLYGKLLPFMDMSMGPMMTADSIELFAELQKYKIDLSQVIKAVLDTDGDISYEELTCVGFDPINSALVGIINVKMKCGYSGNLCQKGSTEYVAFWVDWGDGAGWQYVGTSSVRVHDIANMPPDGLRYAVFETFNTSSKHKPCSDGPVTARVRAILSWQDPPDPANENWKPRWGNREETIIHISPGKVQDYRPILESVSNVPICSINQATGRTSGAYDQPFGKVLRISGFIPNAPDLSTPDAQKFRYRVQVRPWPGGAWQTVDNDFSISVIERIGMSLPVQYPIVQEIQPDGYYIYREDMNVSGLGWRQVQNHVLARWQTAAPMTGMYEIRVEAKNPVTNVLYAAQTLVCADGSKRSSVKVRLDEVAPTCSISITQVSHGGNPPQPANECDTFRIGDILYGTYTVADEHFGKLWMWVEPIGPASGAAPSPSYRAYPVVPTTGETGTWELDTKNMEACGYVVKLWVWDRTIVSGNGTGWKCHSSVGFCLKK